jgi:CMP-N-acetylneuraminic acid synthetase
VVSVVEVPGHYHPEWQLTMREGMLRTYAGNTLAGLPPRRQGLPATYTRNGAIYACRRSILVNSSNLYGERCLPYLMPANLSINLDSELDWRLAEAMLTR